MNLPEEYPKRVQLGLELQALGTGTDEFKTLLYGEIELVNSRKS